MLLGSITAYILAVFLTSEQVLPSNSQSFTLNLNEYWLLLYL